MKNRIAVALAFICMSALFAGSQALADMAPPETYSCLGKSAGAACDYDGAGTCQEQTCIKPSGNYTCMKCVTGTNTATSTQTGTGTSSDSGWCSVGQRSAVGRVAPWLTGGALAMFFLAVRRRKH